MTGRWVVVAPRRGARPVEPHAPSPPHSRPRHDPACPFCPGNEDQLPRILAEWPSAGGEGWRTRVVPNRYPAFTAATLDGSDPGQGERRPAVGVQEVVIETPHHDEDLANLPSEHLGSVVDTWHARIRALAGAEPELHPHLFRNQGRDAGTSLVHAHSQLVATALRAPRVRTRERRLRSAFRDTGRCLLCSLPVGEAGAEARTVTRSDHFTAFVPWAAEAPFETWIVPLRHRAWFGDASPEERAELARLLGGVAGRLRTLVGDPAYNCIVHTTGARRRDASALHWFVQIRPRLSRLAGFELASGITINPSDPEADAARLREGEAFA